MSNNLMNLFRFVPVATDQAVSGNDLFVEFRTVTLTAGTAEVPTVFKNGNVKGMLAMKVDDVTVGGTGAPVSLKTDLIVSSGEITVAAQINTDTSTYFIAIFGVLDI